MDVYFVGGVIDGAIKAVPNHWGRKYVVPYLDRDIKWKWTNEEDSIAVVEHKVQEYRIHTIMTDVRELHIAGVEGCLVHTLLQSVLEQYSKSVKETKNGD